MTGEITEDDAPRKKQKLTVDSETNLTVTTDSAAATIQERVFVSLERPISPPPRRKRAAISLSASEQRLAGAATSETNGPTIIPSPIQLTRIQDLSPEQNVDTVGLADILGDPLIKECWQFNYLHDLDFIMDAFDKDTRHLVQVKVIHGSWKRDSAQRVELEAASTRYPNVEIIIAHMPEAFGTHHTKMMILIRHDNTAQVIIHTANMIPRDWANMTQAMWRSPLLPLLAPSGNSEATADDRTSYPIGSGQRFKNDLLRYLNAYGKRLSELTKQLTIYDFSSIRAALIASTPSRQRVSSAKSTQTTSWGWPGLRQIMSSITVSAAANAVTPPNIVIQISSIATLGQTPAWLQQFQSVLSLSSSSANSAPGAASFFAKKEAKPKTPTPTFNIIFPTASEIRASLDGYVSGGSIHTKIQSAAQQKQLAYLHPLFCHWSNESSTPSRKNAERGPAAPHIKTYIRFSDASMSRIDWAMVTSANLSTQAWGALENKEGEVRISSYEIGVVLWPDLFKKGNEDVIMVPAFAKDMPDMDESVETLVEPNGKAKERAEADANKTTVVGFRMPYDVPLVPYQKGEVPWCATMDHKEPDWRGQTWDSW